MKHFGSNRKKPELMHLSDRDFYGQADEKKKKDPRGILVEPNRFTGFLALPASIFTVAHMSAYEDSVFLCWCVLFAVCQDIWQCSDVPPLMTEGHDCVTTGAPRGWPYQSQSVALLLTHALEFQFRASIFTSKLSPAVTPPWCSLLGEIQQVTLAAAL